MIPSAVLKDLQETLMEAFSGGVEVEELLTHADLGVHKAYVDFRRPVAELWFRTLERLAASEDDLGRLLDEAERKRPESARLRDVIVRARAALLPSPPPVTDRPPYPGLYAYGEADQSLFRGRRDETRQCLSLLEEGGVLFIHGPSGAGKSSLIRAGMLPEVRRRANARGRTCIVIDVRPRDEPLKSLADALKDKVRGDERATLAWNSEVARTLEGRVADVSRSALENVVRALLREPDAECVLLVDQLEEVTALREERLAARDCFLGLLAGCGGLATAREGAGERLRVIVAVRSDLLGDVLAHGGFNLLYKKSEQYLLGALRPEALRAVIVEPLQGRGVRVDDDLPNTIAGDLGHDPGRLPLLNHVLRRMWDLTQEAGAPGMTVEVYQREGRLQEMLGKSADEALRGREGDRAVLNRALLEMVNVEEGRTLRRVVELRALAGQVRCDVSAVYGALKPLVDRYLVILSGEGDRQHAEVAHEALFEGWAYYRDLITQRGPVLALQREVERSAGQWNRSGDERELWPDNTRLRDAEQTMARGTFEALSATATRFIAASRAAIDARARRERRGQRLLRAAVALLLVSLAATVLFLRRARSERSRAERVRQQAEILLGSTLLTYAAPLQTLGRVDLLEATILPIERYLREAVRDGGPESPAALYARQAVSVYRGDIQMERQDLRGAREAYEQARRIIALGMQGEPGKLIWRRAVALNLMRLAQLHVRQADRPSALVAYRRALEVLTGLAAAERGNPEHSHNIAECHFGIAQALLGPYRGAISAEADSVEALAAAERARQAYEGMGTDAQRSPERTMRFAFTLLFEGEVWLRRGNLPAAERLTRRALSALEAMPVEAGTDLGRRSVLSECLSRLGFLRATAGDFAGAIDAHRRSLQLLFRLLEIDRFHVPWRLNAATAALNVAELLFSQSGDRAQALPFARAAVELYQALQREQLLPREVEQRHLLIGTRYVAALAGDGAGPVGLVPFRARVTEAAGVPGVSAGDECHLLLRPPFVPGDTCMVSVQCNGHLLHTAFGEVRCRATGHDPASVVADDSQNGSTLALDTGAGTLVVTHDQPGDRTAGRVALRITGRDVVSPPPLGPTVASASEPQPPLRRGGERRSDRRSRHAHRPASGR